MKNEIKSVSTALKTRYIYMYNYGENISLYDCFVVSSLIWIFMAHKAIPIIPFPQVRTIYIYIYIYIHIHIYIYVCVTCVSMRCIHS